MRGTLAGSGRGRPEGRVGRDVRWRASGTRFDGLGQLVERGTKHIFHGEFGTGNRAAVDAGDGTTAMGLDEGEALEVRVGEAKGERVKTLVAAGEVGDGAQALRNVVEMLAHVVGELGATQGELCGHGCVASLSVDSGVGGTSGMVARECVR